MRPLAKSVTVTLNGIRCSGLICGTFSIARFELVLDSARFSLTVSPLFAVSAAPARLTINAG